MRALLVFLILSTPAAAWQAGFEGQICTLTHTGDNAALRLTYDPAGPLYTITLTRAAPWPDAPVFSLQFDGPAGLTISTNRHVLSNGNLSLTVTDTGFGNVLNGLQFNTTATALIGDLAVPVSLAGAEAPVAAFRTCQIAPVA